MNSYVPPFKFDLVFLHKHDQDFDISSHFGGVE